MILGFLGVARGSLGWLVAMNEIVTVLDSSNRFADVVSFFGSLVHGKLEFGKRQSTVSIV